MVEWEWEGKFDVDSPLSNEVMVKKAEAEKKIAELQAALRTRPSWRNCHYCGARLE